MSNRADSHFFSFPISLSYD